MICYCTQFNCTAQFTLIQFVSVYVKRWCMHRLREITQKLHCIVLILHLFLCDRGDGAMDQIKGVLRQHGCQEFLVMLLLLPQPFALCFHLQAGRGKQKRSWGLRVAEIKSTKTFPLDHHSMTYINALLFYTFVVADYFRYSAPNFH